jgi:hypothetical protein
VLPLLVPPLLLAPPLVPVPKLAVRPVTQLVDVRLLKLLESLDPEYVGKKCDALGPATAHHALARQLPWQVPARALATGPAPPPRPPQNLQ